MKLLHRIINSISAVVTIGLILCGFTFLLIKFTAWTVEHFPLFQEEQHVFSVVIWVITVQRLLKIWEKDEY